MAFVPNQRPQRRGRSMGTVHQRGGRTVRGGNQHKPKHPVGGRRRNR